MSFIAQILGILKEPTKRSHHYDGWYNDLTGLGKTASDKTASNKHSPGVVLTPSELEDLYVDDALAARIINLLPRDALRQGFEIAGPDPSKADEVKKRIHDLKIPKAVLEARIWSRLFGAAGIFLGVIDGVSDLTLPLDPERVQEIRFLKVIDRQSLRIESTISDPMDPNYGEPELYEILPTNSEEELPETLIHASRFIMFPGELTPTKKKAQNQGWDYSTLQRVKDIIGKYQSDWQSTHSMLSDMSQPILKIHEFYKLCAGNAIESFKTRMQMIDVARWVGRIMPIDTLESFEYHDRDLNGVDKILDKMLLPISIAANMPISILFGVSPTGLNATKETDLTTWYDIVHTERTEVLQDPLTDLVKLAVKDLTDPEEISITWPSLWQMSQMEQADYQKKIAETDKIYIDTKVYLPDEVAEHRFGGEEFNDSPVLVDLDARQEDEENEDTEVRSSDEDRPDEVPEDTFGGAEDPSNLGEDGSPGIQ